MPIPVAVWIELSDEERAQLESWARRRTSAQALALRSRIVLLAAEGLNNTEIAARLGVHRTMVRKWRRGLLSTVWMGCLMSRARGTADDHRRAGRGGDHQDAGEHARGRDALVDALDGERGRAHAVGGAADLAGVRAAAPPAGDLEALQGPAVRGQGPRCRRAVPEPARAGRGAVRGREVPDPGAGPDRADPADAARDPERATHDYKRRAPRASTPRWTSPPAR